MYIRTGRFFPLQACFSKDNNNLRNLSLGPFIKQYSDFGILIVLSTNKNIGRGLTMPNTTYRTTFWFEYNSMLVKELVILT